MHVLNVMETSPMNPYKNLQKNPFSIIILHNFTHFENDDKEL